MSGTDGQERRPERPRERQRGGRWWRWPGTALILLLEATLLIGAIGGSALAWRVAQGPVDLSWLLPRVGRAIALAAPQLDVSIGHLAISWRGFSRGPDQPIRIDGAAIRVDEPGADRRFALDRLSVDLSAAWAVRGVVAPRSVTLIGPSMTLWRGAASAPERVGRAMTARDVIGMLGRPPETDRHLVRVRPAALSELTRVVIKGGAVLVEPALRAGDIAALITRGAGGGLAGQVSAILSGGSTLSGTVAIGTGGIVHIQASAKLDDPAALMAALVPPPGTPIPTLPLQASLDVTATPDLTVTALRARLTGGAGTLGVSGATIPVTGLAFGVTGDENHLVVDPGSHIAFGAVSPQPPPTLALGGKVQLGSAGMAGTVTLGIDHVATDDVPAYWPPGAAGAARSWIAAQVHDGVLHDGAFQLGLGSGPGLAALKVVSASGAIPASGLTVAWLPPLPPMTDVQGSIALRGPDAIGVTVNSAHQGDLSVTQSTMAITGLSVADQIGRLAINVTGPVGSALSLLEQPRLNLLKSLPVPLNATGGTMATTVALTLPLESALTPDQIQMKVHSSIQNLALANLLLGLGLTNGQITIDADMTKLHLTGAAALAAIPSQVTLDADFTAGPPTQVIARLTANATADQVALGNAGIPTGGVLSGPARFALSLTALRSGHTDITAKIALPNADLRVAPIHWTGGAGEAAATAHLALQGARIVALDDISLQGPGVSLQVRSRFAQGRLSTLIVDRLLLGRTDLHGSLGFPTTPADPYVLDVAGPALDLSTVWGNGRKPQPSVAPANTALSTISSKQEFQPHPPWRAHIALDRILFGILPGGAPRALEHVNGLAVNDGVVVRSAQIAFVVAPSGSEAHLSIVPNGNGTRSVTLTSGDFGGLLKATNAYDLVTGGVLRIDGTYDDRLPDHPLSGKGEMDNFTLGNAPTVARALVGMTLYGVVDLMQSKGLFFRKLIMPFHLADRRLELVQARAYSASLGLTAHGAIDLPANRFDMQGTIVPAYFFNSMLGHIPFIGRYFAPEKGGGVFAAKYELVGPIDNPQVHVDPLSLITPGFLRGLFGD